MHRDSYEPTPESQNHGQCSVDLLTRATTAKDYRTVIDLIP